jgi:hypothetical protein
VEDENQIEEGDKKKSFMLSFKMGGTLVISTPEHN